MSGDNRRFGGWLLPVIVAGAGAYFLWSASLSGTLKHVAMKPVNWAGAALMAAGAFAAILGKKPMLRLAGVLLCGVGAIFVICL